MLIERSVNDRDAARRLNWTATSSSKAESRRPRPDSDGCAANTVSTPLISASVCPASTRRLSDVSLGGRISGSVDVNAKRGQVLSVLS